MAGNDLVVEGPIVDQESGVQSYTVRGDGGEVSFGVTAEESAEGEMGWVMRLGSDRYLPGDLGFEPYDSPQAAFEAGMRAARQILAPER